MPVSQDKALVALQKCDSYEDADLPAKIFEILDSAQIPAGPGMRALVKPNLLQAKDLACTHPRVVAAVCQWLLDKKASVIVADSPGFGSARNVAAAIGLSKLLTPLGLRVEELDKPVTVKTELPDGRKINFKISRKALEADSIISLPRVKAHSQMRLTLAVKNCFGCVSSLRKAFCHARHGGDTDFFADCIVAIWASLPTVAAVADGIVCMHKTGPAKGEPFHLGLIGASKHAPVLDKALMRVLGVEPEQCPIARAIKRCEKEVSQNDLAMPEFPLLKPDNFEASGFVVPQVLLSASFNPLRLSWSVIRRIAKSLKPAS